MYELKEVHYEITNVCPHNCKHCSTGTIPSAQLKFLDLQTAKRVIDSIAATQGYPKIVHLTGGEPFCHPNLNDILTHMHLKYKFFTSVFTTGFRCDVVDGEKTNIGPVPQDMLLSARNAGLTEAVFSIHSTDPDTQDDIMQTENVLESQYAAMSYLIGLGVHVKVNSVPMVPTMDWMEGVVKQAKSLGCKEVRFLRFVPQGNAEDHEELHVNKAMMRNIVEMVKSLGTRYNDVNFRVVTEGHPQYSKCRPFDWMGEGCQAGISLAHINLNLDVLGCPAFKQKSSYFAGNLKTSKLELLWQNAPVFQQLRTMGTQENLDEPCKSCEYWSMCHGACTAQRCWEGTTIFSSPDPMCPKAT